MPGSTQGAGPPLVVVHLMKTGGFSLVHQLLANLPRSSIWGLLPDDADALERELRYSAVAPLRALDDVTRASIRAVIGHLPFAAVELGGFEGSPVATVVREPVARVTSHLQMIQRAGPDHLGAPLEQIYDDEFVRHRFLTNHQTKMLGMSAAEAAERPPRVHGPPNPAIVEALHDQGYFESAAYLMEVLLDVPLVWPVPVDARTLERATANLERIELLGVHERYDDFLRRLADRTGWTVDPSIRANRGSASPSVSDALRRRIAEDNRLDAELHERARQLVADR